MALSPNQQAILDELSMAEKIAILLKPKFLIFIENKFQYFLFQFLIKENVLNIDLFLIKDDLDIEDIRSYKLELQKNYNRHNQI